MKTVYVVFLNGDIEPKVFTTLSAIASDYNIVRQTLSKAINKSQEYFKEEIKVLALPLIAGKQKGNNATLPHQ